MAKAVIRRKVFKVVDKYHDVSSPERVEEALKCHTLPESLQQELASKYGGDPPVTWFDALTQLEGYCESGGHNYNGAKVDRNKRNNFDKETLWELILDHPITAYVPVQCQACGEHIVPDDNPCSLPSDDAKVGLKEGEPTPEEAPLVRTGWFRGPRLVPSVFVVDCPKCGATSRWFRSRDPKIILNPRRWGRLCGEQEDLRLDLARYLGFISIRTIVPLDWDHIWSEYRAIDEDGMDHCDGFHHASGTWKLRDDDSNFVARLDEGIGSWTGLLAVSPDPEFCSDVTNFYLSCQNKGGRANNQYMSDMKRYRQKITETRKDDSGSLTQAGTVYGYAIQRAGLTSSEITSIMKTAVKEYGTRTWYQVQ